MDHVDPEVVVAVHLGDQIRCGDVEEASRGERHQEIDVDRERRRVGDDASHQERQRREKV